MLGRYTLCNLSVQQIRPVFHFYARHMRSGDSKDKLSSTLENKSTILNLLNKRSSNYISRFKIPVSQVHALQLHKEKHGLYKSLQDVLEVEGMTNSILNEFVKSVINDKQHKKGQKAKKSIIMPTIENISRQKISTVLGIYIGTNVITWTLLEFEENMLEWNYESFTNIPENNSTLNLLELAWQLNCRLPKSDAYVVDDLNYDHRIAKSIQHMKSFLQQQQLRAMILAFLKNRNSNPEGVEPMENLYLTQHEKVANLFGLRIGSEITSSATIVNKLLHKQDNVNNKKQNPIGVYVSENIMNIYENQLNYVQDQMNWSLLTAITFLQLGVHKKYNCDFI